MTPEIYDIIIQLLKDCLIPLLGGLFSLVLFKFKAKIDLEITEKYLALLDKTIVDCVEATNQVFVGDLKNKEEFSAKQQELARKRVLTQVNMILNKKTKKHIERIVGNLEIYILERIEAIVKQSKTK